MACWSSGEFCQIDKVGIEETVLIAHVKAHLQTWLGGHSHCSSGAGVPLPAAWATSENALIYIH